VRRRELLAALASGLAGCGRREPRRGEISLWFTYGGNNRKVLLSLVERFHREQSAVRVHATFQGDYFEGLTKLRTGMFVGSTPTVSHVVGEVVPYLAEAGVLEPLDDVGSLADLDPALAQSGTFTGGEGQPTWALPFNRSTPIAFYNRDLFAELGLEPPSTWEALREVARAATLRRRGVTERWGFECPLEWWFWVAMVGQAGGQVVEDDGTVSLGGEAGIEALSLWQTMVHQDRTMKPPPGRDYNAWEASNGDFLAGRAAMIWTSTAFLRYLEDEASFSVGAAPLPRHARHAVPTGGTFFVMPKGIAGAEREAGLTFLRFMMAPAQANEWATRTGYMPVSLAGRHELEEQGYYRSHPNDAVTLAQLAYAMPWPWSPTLFRVQREAVQPRLEEAVLSQIDAREMLARARRAAEAP
jgi:sn-glycerol 3-phosphate transport system substrate-binding protein